MKTPLSIPYSFLSIFIIITLVFLSVALISPGPQKQNVAQKNDLEVGSTTGITILGLMIAAVIILPLLASGEVIKRKKEPKK